MKNDKEFQDKLKQYRESKRKSEETNPCYIDKDCMELIVNWFFYGVIVLAIVIVVNGFVNWIF